MKAEAGWDLVQTHEIFLRRSAVLDTPAQSKFGMALIVFPLT
jgi:hypothetical protein